MIGKIDPEGVPAYVERGYFFKAKRVIKKKLEPEFFLSLVYERTVFINNSF